MPRSRLLPLALLLATPALASAQRQAELVAIERVHVVPMDRERVLRDHTVLVRDGVIAAVGPAGSVRVPAGARRVDGAGGYLIPGLTDAHVHLYYGTAGLPSYLAHGVTTVWNLNGSAEVLDWRRRVAAGALVGPTIYTAGNTVDGSPPLNPLFTGVATPAGARRVVAAQQAAGYDFIKVYSNLDTAAYAAVLDEAARRRIAVVGHVPQRVGWRGVLATGGRQANVAHIEEFFQQPIADSSFSEVVRLAREAGLAVTVNLFAYSDYLRAIAELPALRGVLADAEMRFASPAAYSEKLPANNRANRPNPEQFGAALRQRQARFRVLARMLRDAGVPLLVGTDTEIFGFAGESAVLEVRELVASGFTPYQALEAATRVPGEFVARHVSGATPVGTVAVGQRADLVLLAGNPLADIGQLASIRGVMARGRWLARARLDTLRDSVARTTAGVLPLVARFDSLAGAGDVRAAAATMAELRRRYPHAPPIAEVVMRAYGRRLAARDPAASVAMRTMATELYPRSFAAWAELARGTLAAGDTAAAVSHFRRALALNPEDEWIAAELARAGGR